ncbi:MAG TPA: hypothetical protein VML57_04155 [Burkholderiales bacterium]|nr:hypothetical protein [Burkholderiales bacterium]
MEISEEQVRRYAQLRIAKLFHVEPEALSLQAVFGDVLKASFVSDFKANEFEQLDRDVKDVADRQTLQELASGALVIRTVDDYCDHMVRCYRTKPEEVMRVLRMAK